MKPSHITLIMLISIEKGEKMQLNRVASTRWRRDESFALDPFSLMSSDRSVGLVISFADSRGERKCFTKSFEK